MRRYIEQAGRTGEKRITRAIDVLLGAASNLRWLALPRVQLECAFVRITTPEEEPQNLDILLERVEQLEQKLKNGMPLQTAPVQPAPAKTESHSKAEQKRAAEDVPPWEDALSAVDEVDYVPPSDGEKEVCAGRARRISLSAS